MVDAPERAFVLASRISDSVPKAMILEPCSLAILVLVSSRFFDSFSRSASLRSIASFAFLGSEGRPVHGGPSLAPSAVVTCLASSWNAAGKIARKVWVSSDVLVIAKIRFPWVIRSRSFWSVGIVSGPASPTRLVRNPRPAMASSETPTFSRPERNRESSEACSFSV